MASFFPPFIKFPSSSVSTFNFVPEKSSNVFYFTNNVGIFNLHSKACVILSVLIKFSENENWWRIIKTMFYLIVLIAALELMGPRYRTFAGMVICMFFASAMSLLALLVSILKFITSLLVNKIIIFAMS